MLVYPAASWWANAADAGDAPSELVALLGRTRAACLAALRRPHTTSGLAHELGISVGTASKQATVLRDAGLLRSRRIGGAVVHTISALGTDLLADGRGFPLRAKA